MVKKKKLHCKCYTVSATESNTSVLLSAETEDFSAHAGYFESKQKTKTKQI